MGTVSEQLVAEFLSEYRSSGGYLRGHVARLAELAASEDEQVAEPATRSVFTSLVEQLADSFEPGAVNVYNRAFAQVIQACRRNPGAAPLDDNLERFGLQSEEDLIARAETLRRVSPLPLTHEWAQRMRRVIVLSRVTLGADVAITSVIIERMKQSFPEAEIVLVGGRKASELFGGDRRLQFKEITYRRAGTTMQRLLSWIGLLKAVRDLTRELGHAEYLIVDPDTRLTQLGLLPITGEGDSSEGGPLLRPDHLFFPSREYGSSTTRSLSELTSTWLDEVLSAKMTTYPQACLNGGDLQSASRVVQAIRRSRSGPIVTLNFGVGETPAKRIGDEFEQSLVSTLIRHGTTVILDKGAGQEEIERADRVIAAATQIELDGRHARVVEMREQNLTSQPDKLDAELVVWDGRIGMLAALIGQSDLYVGYDSAGQHIAAALGVPCIDVFAGFSSARMLERWRPTGKAETRVVAVETLTGDVSTNAVLSRVLSDASEMLSRATSL
ncbi:MAG: glycosyltransferase family 9 protein [Acidobacteriota bacterium]